MSATIKTSHAGSLPRPDDLIGDAGQTLTDEELAAAVAGVVARQRQIGIDIVNDGEYGHALGARYDYGGWWTYMRDRLDGLELVDPATLGVPSSTRQPGEISLASFGERRDRQQFAEAYADPASGCALPGTPQMVTVCRGPLTYKGQERVQRDISNMKAALATAGLKDGFLNAVAPGSCARFRNEFYKSDEELVYACADAMREEYRAIIDAGLMLQLDDPAIADSWDQISPEPTVEEYRRFTTIRIEALNHAIRDLPAERIRFHLCWGSWHGPHVTDIPMATIVDLMLRINAGSYTFEAANVRHAHEWRVWEEVKLPEGKKILPGIVSHSTNVVEHPELVAERISRFASLVGAENVVASTDCGLGGRVHPQVAWAKLEALVEGARLASALA